MNTGRPSASRVPRQVKAQPIMIRLAPDEIEKAEQYASNEVRSRASFLRMMILKGLQAYERELATQS